MEETPLGTGPAEKPRRQGGYGKGDKIADRYEVIKGIGRGGMGVVYLVNDTQNGQQLALKSILPQYASHEYAVKRFIREVNAVRKMNHPCIVKIFDAQKSDDLLYYTMEYLDGQSLYKWMQRRGQMGLGSTVRVMSLLCSALEHAHQYTVHRDLSPDNVMVMKDGSIKLLDFGLAKLTTVESSFTMIGTHLGKREYNAPEQRANARDVDLRADIYSLGVIFFEMLAGERPEGEKHLIEARPDLPSQCDAIVLRCMAEDPEDRYPNALELRKALMNCYEVYKQQGESPQLFAPAAKSKHRTRLDTFLSKARAFLSRFKR
jgi:serine/threonine-protein kinase